MTRYRKGLLFSLLIIGSCCLGLREAGAATIPVNADITVSERWTAGNEYLLGTVVYVTNGATLTIEPGTVVRGSTRSCSRMRTTTTSARTPAPSRTTRWTRRVE